MSTAAFNTNEKIYKLDDDTLFLLRIRAMEDMSAFQTKRKFQSEDDLRSHISSISETKCFFTGLKCMIGESHGKRRRTPLYLYNIWRDISSVIKRRIMNSRFTPAQDDKAFITDIFGFDTFDSLCSAAQGNENIPAENIKVSTDIQDHIAQIFGYNNWMDLASQDSKKYLVSESVLQRAFGIYECKSSLSMPILNHITQYMCNMNWLEYNTPTGRKEAKRKILSRVITPEMKPVINELPPLPMPNKTTIPGIQDGDIIKIEHTDGTSEMYRYTGKEFQQINTNTELCA